MPTTALPDTSLRRTLSLRHVPQLRELAKSYHVTGHSRMRKEALVTSVFEALLNQERLTEICYVLDPKTWALFRQAAGEASIPLPRSASTQYKLLVELGYLECMDAENGSSVFVPDEIKAVLSDLFAGGLAEQKAFFDSVHTYAQAAANLYGVIGLMDFAALFNAQTDRKVSVEEMAPALLRHISVDAEYCIWEQYLIGASYKESEERITRLVSAAQGIPRYVPEQKELLRYAKSDYFERTPQVERLETYLLEKLELSKAGTKKAVTLLHFGCQIGAAVDFSVRLLYDYKQDLTARQLSEVTALVERMFAATRLPVYNGHTAEEMKQLGGVRQAQKSRKIGRNDPCPCGSGRKFKKCCGRWQSQ